MRTLNVDDFISRWQGSGGSERANFQQFAIELTQLLGVPGPKPATADMQNDDYRFERPVTFIHTGTQSRGFIDLYRRGAFVMEAKQGTGRAGETDDAQLALLPDLPPKQRQGHGQRGSRRWDDTMLRARNQADGYARAVARNDGWPPFLIIVDVGHVIEVYADFSGQGQGYTQYPDGARYRIALDDLRDKKTCDRLRTIWTDPLSLDPAKISAEVTREVADRLAALGRSFEGQGHDPQDVARFLMRCLFTMFAEDVDLIPHASFSGLLKKLRGHPEHAAPSLKGLWETMNTGGFSQTLMTDLKRFNGGLFKDANALPLNAVQLSLLIDAAGRDWKEVEPAIFGTLLERALDKRQRHKLGAHYTPRAYVERLVVPTVIEPLRADWRDVQAAAVALPDPQARVQVLDYLKPKPAIWPEAEFIVGNPPFIGASRMRDALGDGYAEALWAAYPKMPQSADFVMFWWDKAALAARGWKPGTDKGRAKGTRRFGFITTNSLRQTFNRRVLEPHLSDPKSPLSLTFAIPDHPWVDAGDGAAVRIAMTVAEAGKVPGRLGTVTDERKGEYEAEGRPVRFEIEKGKIFADLRIGADVAGAGALSANEGLGHKGVMPYGMGFVITPEEARGLLQSDNAADIIRQYLNGRDLNGTSRNLMIIDCFGMSEAELRESHPKVFQLLMDRVKPEREANREEVLKQAWWIFGRPRTEMRKALAGLTRYIATTETAKHRIFVLLNNEVLADQKIRIIASPDADVFAVLTSRIHEAFSLARCNWQGYGNDPVYTHSNCFNPFPFPTPTDTQKTHLRHLGEQLDAHRKAQQAAHPKLTLTAMYNVLEKLRAKQRIEGKDRQIYDQGLIGILRDLHDQIDTVVAGAYGWPVDLSDDDILHRLVDLNRERAAEEARGHIRWLRPDYQNPAGHAAAAKAEQGAMDLGPAVTTAKTPWPKTLPEQIAAVRAALTDLGTATPEQVARQFARARASSVQPLLQSLTALGQAQIIEGGRFAI